MKTRNIRLLIQYEGTRYKGWQRLKNSDKSIQGKIEELLSKMTGEEILITGSGRTDAGVHALEQTANFRTLSVMKCGEIAEYCNSYLPDDILVTGVYEADDNFHSRYNAVSKCYLYRIWNSPLPDIFRRKLLYHVRQQLDTAKMRQGASFFEGTHDFQSFTALKAGKKDTIREIKSVIITQKEKLIEIRITGSGFLYLMARLMAGTLIECGLGNIRPEDISAIMDKKERRYAGPAAPPCGLYLEKVYYI